MTYIPPVSHIYASSKTPHQREVQAILDSHCEKYHKGIPAGCNLQVMLGNDGKQSYLLHAGGIEPNGPQN